MFDSNTYEKRETAQRLIWRYDLFSQILRLKAMNKRTFFCFNAAFTRSLWYECNLGGI